MCYHPEIDPESARKNTEKQNRRRRSDNFKAISFVVIAIVVCVLFLGGAICLWCYGPKPANPAPIFTAEGWQEIAESIPEWSEFTNGEKAWILIIGAVSSLILLATLGSAGRNYCPKCGGAMNLSGWTEIEGQRERIRYSTCEKCGHSNV